MAQKTVEVNETILAKQAEQTNAGRAEDAQLTEDEVLQGLVDAAGAKIKRNLLEQAWRSLNEADKLTALDAVSANPLT